MLVQFVKFSLIGLLNTAIHYAVFLTLYEFVEMHHLFASGLGFCFAVTNSYFINKYWTFKSKNLDVRQEFIRFMIVNLVSLAVNLTSMAILVELLSFEPSVAQLITITLTLIINFTGNRFWAFREKHQQLEIGNNS